MFDPEAVLQTPRLMLEPLAPRHAALLHEHLLYQPLYRFIPKDPPASPQALEDRYRKLHSRRSPDGRESWLNWALRLRRSGDCAGVLEATVHEDRTATVAYTVFVSHQRQGIAAEACGRLISHLFEDYGVIVVAAEMDTRNAASIALVEALGFERVATIDRRRPLQGRVERRTSLRASSRERHGPRSRPRRAGPCAVLR